MEAPRSLRRRAGDAQGAVTRSPAIVPGEGGGPDGPAEVRIESGFDSAELTGDAMRELDGVAATLSGPKLAVGRVTPEGRTDVTGRENCNLRLLQRRAEAHIIAVRN